MTKSGLSLAEQVVIQNALYYSDRWKNQDSSELTPHWLEVLEEETSELKSAIEGKHEHFPEVELIQIGGIVLNWLCHFEPDALNSALQISTHSRKKDT